MKDGNSFGLFYSDKSEQRTIETLLEGLEEHTKVSLLNLRLFVKSLGDNVIEEVRPHRLVYAKSLTFRTFLDIKTGNNYLSISIMRGRNEPVTNYTIRATQGVEDIKREIAEAYKKIK